MPAFESKTKLYIKAEVDFNKPFACQICGSRFASNQNLQSHVIKLHSEHYNCCFCKKAFALDKVEDFKLHMFKHDNKMLKVLKYHTKMCPLQESTINIIDQLPEKIKIKIEQPLTQRKKYVPIKKVRLEMVRLMLGQLKMMRSNPGYL